MLRFDVVKMLHVERLFAKQKLECARLLFCMINLAINRFSWLNKAYGC